MAPTVQIGSASERDRKQKLGEKKSDMICKVKYCNNLPDIPFDPKFIKYPFMPSRFIDYKPTSLERNYKHDLLTEQDLGVVIDLINPHTYEPDPCATLHPDDERLLEDDALTPQDSKRSRHHSKTVPWLKKTEYISNEFNRYGNTSEKTETKVGYNVKKLFKEENTYSNRESQINAINKTFSDAKTSIEKHYSKPGVVPVDVLPVFPDFELWRHPFAQVMFDNDPAQSSQIEEMSQAMIRGVVDESGEQFVAYFLPTEETLKKRKQEREADDDDDEEEYEYKMAREYNWNVKNKASKGYEENYFFVFRENGVYYNELETRVRLSKRRAKPGVPPNNSVLSVRHRPYSELEFKHQKARLSQLDPPLPEDEEEEEEDQEMAGDGEAGENEQSDVEKEDKESDGEEAMQTDDEARSERAAESDKEESEKAVESDDEGNERRTESDREADSDRGGASDNEAESDREGSERGAESDREADSDRENRSTGEVESDREGRSDNEVESDRGGRSDNESERGGRSDNESERGGGSDNESERGAESDKESERGAESDKESDSDGEAKSAGEAESDREGRSDNEVESDRGGASENEVESNRGGSDREATSDREVESENEQQSSSGSEKASSSESEE